jgi:hypothetical protein
VRFDIRATYVSVLETSGLAPLCTKLSGDDLGGLLTLPPRATNGRSKRIVTAITCEKQPIFNWLRVDFSRIRMAHRLVGVRA